MNDKTETTLSLADAAAVGMHIAVHAAAAPGRLAIDGPLGRRSYGELNGACNRLVRFLRGRGCARATRSRCWRPTGPSSSR